MSMAIATDPRAQSVYNEALKIKRVFEAHGFSTEILDIFSRPSKRYDGLIFWSPFTHSAISQIFKWDNGRTAGRVIYYFVIEGVLLGGYIHSMWLGAAWKKYIATPSVFAKSMVEKGCLCPVREVIPHQIDPDPPVDHEYGKRWRSRFGDKKVILYNGSNIVRKGLWKLREAIDILSKRRRDFVVVIHTSDVRLPMHTPVSSLYTVNTIVEPEFGKLSMDKVYAKMLYTDYVVLPSLVEGFGLPVLEALNLGKPVITIDTYGVNEIVDPSNSFMVTRTRDTWISWMFILFKARDYDPQDLADTMDQALSASREEIQDKVARGKEKAARYHNTYKRFVELLGGG